MIEREIAEGLRITPNDITAWYLQAIMEYNHTEYPLGYGLEQHIGNYIFKKVEQWA